MVQVRRLCMQGCFTRKYTAQARIYSPVRGDTKACGSIRWRLSCGVRGAVAQSAEQERGSVLAVQVRPAVLAPNGGISWDTVRR